MPDYYYESEEVNQPRELPQKQREESFSVSEPITTRPADPEKLQALRDSRKKIIERRINAGLEAEPKDRWGT